MALRGVDVLFGELEKAKVGLKDVDKNIAKLTGRDPTESVPRGGQRRSWGGEDTSRGRARIFSIARRGSLQDDGPPAKRGRTVGGAFSRLGPRVVVSRLAPRQDPDSGEEDFDDKPVVQSSVVATPTSNRSREEVAESQSKDRESKGRNRRMFGLLLGTLRKFKDEEKMKSDKEQQRKAVEEKLEQKAKKEKDEVRKERRKLFQERQQKEEKIKRIEQKMELVKIHQEWESQTRILGNFIRTKSKPHLYYIPKVQVSTTKDRLKQTKELLEKIIQERRQQLEEEIEELTQEDEDKVEEDEPMEENLSRSVTITDDIVDRKNLEEGDVCGDDSDVNERLLDIDEKENRLIVMVNKDDGAVWEGGQEGVEAKDDNVAESERNVIETEIESDKQKRSSCKRSHSQRENDDRDKSQAGEEGRAVVSCSPSSDIRNVDSRQDDERKVMPMDQEDDAQMK